MPPLNPLKWDRPVQIIAALALLVIVVSALTGGVTTAWAKHIANRALRGIASSISDIDRVEGEAAAKEQAVEALGRQAQELQQKADALEAENAELKTHLTSARKDAADASRKLTELKRVATTRAEIKTLDQALAAIVRALADNP